MLTEYYQLLCQIPVPVLYKLNETARLREGPDLTELWMGGPREVVASRSHVTAC